MLDQLSSSACTGHAVSSGAVAALQGAGHYVEIPSPVGLYVGGLMLTRAEQTDDDDEALPPLVDEGAYPNAVLRAMLEVGCGATVEDWPLDVSNVVAEPKWGQLRAQSLLRLRGFYRLSGLSAKTRLDALKRALSQRYPVVFAVDVDSEFCEHTGPGLVRTELREGNLGGHYLAATGYETYPSGRVLVRFRNSWGRGWGNDGDGVADAAWIARWRDVYVLHVTPT